MKEILITSSVLIAVILLVRRLFRGKVSHRLIYAAWILVALRLLIPIQFGQSAYSVIALTETIENQSKPIQQVQEVLQTPVVGPSQAELYEQLLNQYIQQGSDPAQPEVQQQIETQVEEQITGPTLSQILTAVWLAGIAVMAAWFLTTNVLYLRRAKRDSVPFTEVSAPIPVRVCSHVPTPCLVGLLRPVICLTPESTENKQSLNHVLTHELTHLRHWDHVWSLVRCICLCIYWFDPLVWIAAAQSRRDCELACDESALKKLGDTERIAYGQTLLATVTQYKSPAHLLQTATAMNETKKQLKERVSFIVKKPRNILIAAICLILAAALAAGCAFTGGKTTGPEHTEPIVTDPIDSTEPMTTDSTEPTVDTVTTFPTGSGYQQSFWEQPYRHAYYLIWTEFSELLDQEQYQDWVEFTREYENPEEMLLVTMIKRYNIPREDFDAAAKKMIAKSAILDWNARTREYEVPNGDIIYTFDNEIINAYYRTDAPVYQHPPGYTVTEADPLPDAAVLPEYQSGSIELEDPMMDDYNFDRQYREAYYRRWNCMWELLDDAQKEELDSWLDDFDRGEYQQEMLLVSFIKHFDIPREEFEQAVVYYMEAAALTGHDLNHELYEAPNVDIIYTLDNEIINEYYRYE